jgi:hypothetical protein
MHQLAAEFRLSRLQPPGATLALIKASCNALIITTRRPLLFPEHFQLESIVSSDRIVLELCPLRRRP